MKRLSYYRDACDPAGYLVRLGRREPPSFIFHEAEPERLARQFEALDRKGLRGVSCADVDWSDPDPRDVVLTFDDGHASLYDVAWPLLRRHGFRATAFLSPGLMETAGAGADRSRGRLVDFDAVRRMHQSGVLDVQLHGYAHARLFVSERIIDFARPGRPDVNLGVSAWRVRREGRETCDVELAPGEPIYEYGSRWGPHPRFLDSERVREACRRRVEQGGGAARFFADPDWRGTLDAVARDARSASDEGWETPEERDADRRLLLRLARDRLRAETGAHTTHFALPWAEEGPGVEEAALACGIEHVHLGYLSPVEYARANRGALPRHPRLKEFFLDRLPGPGRPSLPAFLAGEIRRMARSEGRDRLRREG
ncbi:MAG TPA: polysaccharide deacetylase family protein [Gemmatimonadota bacterium]|nr:polysaccharide deacetylase family protein [Gemmatimonadota bacterium]